VSQLAGRLPQETGSRSLPFGPGRHCASLPAARWRLAGAAHCAVLHALDLWGPQAALAPLYHQPNCDHVVPSIVTDAWRRVGYFGCQVTGAVLR
jgi:hypothetical protein